MGRDAGVVLDPSSPAGVRPAPSIAAVLTDWPVRRSVGCAVFGGVALFLAAPPVGAWPLVVVGPALLVVAVAGRSSRAAFGVGTVFGLAYFGPLLWWLVNLGVLPWAALVVVQALFVGAHGLLMRVLLGWRWWPLTVALSWVVVESVRGAVPLGGFPWGRLGFSQADAPSLSWAAIGGVPLLTLLAAAVGAALAALVLGSVRRAVVGLVVLAATGVWLGAGLLPDRQSSGQTATVAVVQGNVPRGRDLAEQVRVRQVTQNHADATIALAEDVRAGRVPAPDLVVWPENSTDTDPRRDPAIAAVIQQAVHAIGRPVLVGGFRVDDSGRTFNVGQVWAPGEGPVGEYAKRQLVPFGEYVPFRGLFGWVGQLQLVPRDLTPGTGDGVLTAAGVRFGDVICYEVAYDHLVRSSVDAGARLLVVQTNNATYMRDGQTGETLQQLAMARVRAVEHGRSVLVSSTTGVSAVIRPDGSLAAATQPWQRQVLVERVELSTAPAQEVSPWIERLAGLVVAGTVAWMLIQARRARPGIHRAATDGRLSR